MWIHVIVLEGISLHETLPVIVFQWKGRGGEEKLLCHKHGFKYTIVCLNSFLKPSHPEKLKEHKIERFQLIFQSYYIVPCCWTLILMWVFTIDFGNWCYLNIPTWSLLYLLPLICKNYGKQNLLSFSVQSRSWIISGDLLLRYLFSLCTASLDLSNCLMCLANLI